MHHVTFLYPTLLELTQSLMTFQWYSFQIINKTECQT
jgi:hypothetical protein